MKIILIIFLFFSGQCYAQKDTVYNLKDIEVEAVRIKTDIFNSPNSVSILDDKAINSVNGSTLSDVLSLADGVSLKSYGGGVALSTLTLNGLGAEHTLVLIDGARVNNFQLGQTDLSLIPKDRIERIEILNNGSSSLYGSDAIAGVVNIITKKTGLPNLSFNAVVGSYSRRRFSLGGSKSLGKLSASFLLSKEDANNDFDYIYNDGLRSIDKRRENNSYSLLSGGINLTYLTGKNVFNLITDYNYTDRNIPGIETGSAPSQSKQVDKIFNSSLTYERYNSVNAGLKVLLNYQKALMDYTTRPGDIDHYNNISYSLSTQYDFMLSDIKTASGFELLYASLESTSSTQNIDRFQPALFTAFEIPIGNLKIFPSARVENISDIEKTVFSGKLGINYQPVKKLPLHFRSSIGNNFKAPTFNGLYWEDVGNPNLRPESSVNFDAGMIYSFDFLAKNILEAKYIRIDAVDKIVWMPTGSIWTPRNIDNSLSEILSVSLTSSFNIDDLDAGIHLNYTHNKSVKTSENYKGDPAYLKQIIYIPLDDAKASLNLSYKDFGTNFIYNFIGKRFTDSDNRNFLSYASVIDCNVSYQLNISSVSSELRLEVNNLFNEDYQILSGYPMPLRNINLSLRITR